MEFFLTTDCTDATDFQAGLFWGGPAERFSNGSQLIVILS
jgi:hypothetical protein